MLLALDMERFAPLGQEQRARETEDVPRGKTSAGPRLRHQSGGEVDRISHDRVRAPVARPDLAGEHRPPIDPDVNREVERREGDLVGGEEHLLCVEPGGLRDTRK